ncbi:MAG: phenylalanine--tRNA ligase subunit alpha, partial [Gammaproteobacteria bacterium]|nr:phenylalanine--tRNA ligase subunit alpha [Gammaproteobacteria bacterium]
MDNVETLLVQARDAVATARDLAALDAVRVRYLGKKGQLTALLKQLGGMPGEQRRAQGQVINAVKEALTQALDLRRQQLEANALG